MMLLLGAAWAIGFGDGTLPDGATVVSEHVTHLDLFLDVNLLGARYERAIQRRHRQRSTVETAGGALLVEWSENRHQAVEPGHAHDRVLPVVGHRYRIEAGRVERADGTAATSEEAEIVGQVQLPGQLVAVAAMLAGEVEVGEIRPAGAMLAGILADAPGEPELVAGTLRLDRVEEGVGHVAVELHLRSVGTDAKRTRIQTDAYAKGWLEVEVASGRTRRLALEGTVAVDATRPDLKTTGKGTFSTVTTLELR